MMQEESRDYDQEKLEELWVEIANQRNKEIEDGTVTAIPGEEVMNRLRSRYSHKKAQKPQKA